MGNQEKPKPTGWDLVGHGTAKWHWFGLDGRSLCGKWANMTWNTLQPDAEVHPLERCAACHKKREKIIAREDA